MRPRVQAPVLRKKKKISQPLVAYICNSNYFGGRHMEDHGLKPAWANSSQKRAGGVIQGMALSSSPSIAKKKNTKLGNGTLRWEDLLSPGVQDQFR
jgi:hypothetical protein